MISLITTITSQRAVAKSRHLLLCKWSQKGGRYILTKVFKEMIPFFRLTFAVLCTAKGIFGVPLAILVERTGVDAGLGYGGSSVRMPSSVNESISVMKQMDKSKGYTYRR